MKRALFGGFIDHYSRVLVEGRYYLTEDFAALRFGFRQMLAVHGMPTRLFLDNGSAFHAIRFHAACAALGIQLVHSKPYVAESRGVIERWNRTFSKTIADKTYIQKVLEPLGFEAAPPSGEPVEAFAQFLVRDKALYIRIKNEAKLKTGE